MCKTGILAGSFLAFASGLFREKKARFFWFTYNDRRSHPGALFVPNGKRAKRMGSSTMLLYVAHYKAIRILENPILTLL